MATIKVKTGGCGIKYTDAKGKITYSLKTPKDGAFECDDAQAAHLVALGAAAYVGEHVPAPAAQDDAQQEGAGKMTGHLDAEELAAMNYNDLKQLAADMGVHPVSAKKADIIAALAAAEVEIDEAAIMEGDDDLPDLSAADPE